jgi:sugar lactone lactonase YvrE
MLFNLEGNLIRSFGRRLLAWPQGINVDADDNVWIKEWGSRGNAPDQLFDPHALTMDSRGRLFVGDRGDNRIQIYSQDGELLDSWIQFGRPSGLYIDANDMLYVADSESNETRNPGWKRGIRIGSTKTGEVTAFIPDPEPDQDGSPNSGAEGLAADVLGNIYGAEVGSRDIKQYRLQ